MLALNASVEYQWLHETAAVNYFHGTNSGSGYLLGGKVDNVSANISRGFGRNVSVGLTGSYLRTTSLTAAQPEYGQNGQVTIVPINFAGVTDAKFGGVQATRQLGRYMNAFANYTAIGQSSSIGISTLGYNENLLNGLYQVIGFGIGYSPREMHFKK